MDSQGGHVMTIANSIIGVSILAMPYCFKQCGLVLAILMLILSSIISRLSCHFLLKSAVIAKHKSIESLALFAFGSCGKLTIELGIIGFLLGTCIAFFVVMGDLGPQIIADMVGVPATDTLRTSVLIFLAIFCILPLGLLRQVDSLTVVCTAAIGFYMCLVLKIMAESAPHLMYGDWYNQVYFWRTDGILQCLPIFSMALFCQTQLFEIYQAIPNANVDRMNNLIRMAINICTCVYIFVGTFGYIAVCDQPFSGNILLSFKSSLMTEIIKIGFVLSVAVSFPLIIFPCRASLFSMTKSQTYKSMEYGKSYIPDANFRYLTVGIISISLLIGVLVPNIELVLGLVGSTIGVLICVLFPATSFICLSKKNTNERILAQVMIFIGILVMVLGTYANLNVVVDAPNKIVVEKVEVINPIKTVDKDRVVDTATTVKIVALPNIIEKGDDSIAQAEISNEVIHEVRHEPPQPVEPEPEPIKHINLPIEKDMVQIPNESQPEKPKVDNSLTTKKLVSTEAGADLPKLQEQLKLSDNNKVESVELGSEAIKKEDKEIKLQQEESLINEEKAKLSKLKQETEQLLEKIDSGKEGKENVEKEAIISEKKVELDQLQKKTEELLEKQQKILVEIQQSAKEDMVRDEIKAEQLKSIKEIEHIAKSAIESVVERGKNTEKSVLKEIIEPQRMKDDVQLQIMMAPQPKLNLLNSNETRAKIPNIPENFVPIPIVKSNLSMYSMDAMKNITGNKKIEEKKTASKPEMTSVENKIAIENQKVEVGKPVISDTKSEIKVELPKLENINEINADKQKEALESVRRDILSFNRSRMRREVKDDNEDKDKSGQCRKDKVSTLGDNSRDKSDKTDQSLT